MSNNVQKNKKKDLNLEIPAPISPLRDKKLSLMKTPTLKLKNSQSRSSKLSEQENKSSKSKHSKNTRNPNQLFIDEYLIHCLQKHPHQRNLKDLEYLGEELSKVQFFQNLIQQYEQNTFYNCCLKIKHMMLPTEQILFHLGQVGDNFYIILKGAIAIYIKNNNQKTEEETKEEKENLKSPGAKPKTQMEILYPHLFKVAVLKEGASFGELALLQPDLGVRMATAVAEVDTELAFLSKGDYQSILKEKEEQKQFVHINYFQSLPCFKDKINYKNAQKLFMHTTVDNFIKNQVLYKQGEPEENMYFIISGTYQLSKNEYYTQKELNQNKPSNMLYLPSTCKLNFGNQIKKEIIIGDIGENQVIGYEELILGINRQYTLRCISKEGSAYIMDKKNFKQFQNDKFFQNTIMLQIDNQQTHHQNIEENHKQIFNEHQNLVSQNLVIKNRLFSNSKDKNHDYRLKMQAENSIESMDPKYFFNFKSNMNMNSTFNISRVFNMEDSFSSHRKKPQKKREKTIISQNQLYEFRSPRVKQISKPKINSIINSNFANSNNNNINNNNINSESNHNTYYQNSSMKSPSTSTPKIIKYSCVESPPQRDETNVVLKDYKKLHLKVERAKQQYMDRIRTPTQSSYLNSPCHSKTALKIEQDKFNFSFVNSTQTSGGKIRDLSKSENVSKLFQQSTLNSSKSVSSLLNNNQFLNSNANTIDMSDNIKETGMFIKSENKIMTQKKNSTLGKRKSDLHHIISNTNEKEFQQYTEESKQKNTFPNLDKSQIKIVSQTERKNSMKNSKSSLKNGQIPIFNNEQTPHKKKSSKFINLSPENCEENNNNYNNKNCMANQTSYIKLDYSQHNQYLLQQQQQNTQQLKQDHQYKKKSVFMSRSSRISNKSSEFHEYLKKQQQIGSYNNINSQQQYQQQKLPTIQVPQISHNKSQQEYQNIHKNQRPQFYSKDHSVDNTDHSNINIIHSTQNIDQTYNNNNHNNHNNNVFQENYEQQQEFRNKNDQLQLKIKKPNLELKQQYIQQNREIQGNEMTEDIILLINRQRLKNKRQQQISNLYERTVSANKGNKFQILSDFFKNISKPKTNKMKKNQKTKLDDITLDMIVKNQYKKYKNSQKQQ